MNRICIEKATNKLIEFQEGNAPLGTLTSNAITAGYSEVDVAEEYTDLELSAAKLMYESAADTVKREAREADATQRMQDMIDNLPNWQAVSDSVDAIGDMTEAKVFIKKLARVIYWLAKNSKD